MAKSPVTESVVNGKIVSAPFQGDVPTVVLVVPAVDEEFSDVVSSNVIETFEVPGVLIPEMNAWVSLPLPIKAAKATRKKPIWRLFMSIPPT